MWTTNWQCQSPQQPSNGLWQNIQTRSTNRVFSFLARALLICFGQYSLVNEQAALRLQGFGALGAVRTTSNEVEFVRDLSQPRGASQTWDAIRGELTSIFPYRQESAGCSGKMDIFSLTMDLVF